MSDVELQADELTPQLLDFKDAQLIPNPGPGSLGPILHVTGEAPCMNMSVKLSPVRYIRQPEYWAIHVVGILEGGICLEAVRPFHEILGGVPLGTKGIVVVGETTRKIIENL